jgi:prepilin-type N-terminal cleavage/methylation domain-containing protein
VVKKRGFSLTELIVSVTIFVIVVTLAVGGIASVSRTKMLIASMKESQQKTRVITEILTRYGKEAIYVTVSDRRVDYIFEDKAGGASVKSAKSYIISGTAPNYNSLKYYSCNSTAVDPITDTIILDVSTSINNGTAATGCESEELLSSAGGFNFNLQKVGGLDFFKKQNTIPASIKLNMNLFNITPTNNFYSDSMKIEKTILLENLK